MYLLVFLLLAMFCLFMGGLYATSTGRRGVGFLCGLIPFVVGVVFVLWISDERARELPIDIMLPVFMAPAIGLMTMFHSLFSSANWRLFPTKRRNIDDED